jgi:hypothetical protein
MAAAVISLTVRPPPGRVASAASAAPSNRTAAADLIEDLIFTQDWGDARVADDFENSQQSAAAWGIARAAAWRLLAFRDEVTPEDATSATDAGQRAALCFAQQMLAQERGRHPREAEAILDSFLDLAKHN